MKKSPKKTTEEIVEASRWAFVLGMYIKNWIKDGWSDKKIIKKVQKILNEIDLYE